MTSVAAPPKTNTFALIGFIAAFVIPVVGIVLGALATRQISQTREGGRGLARWAIIVGGLGTLFQLLFVIVWLGLVLSTISAAPYGR